MKILVLIVLLAASVVSLAQGDSTNSKSDHYFEVGVILGTPLFVNPILGYEFDRFGLSISGSYLGKEAYGVHLSSPFRFYMNKGFSNALCLVFENSWIGEGDSSHFVNIGPTYELRWNWFLANLGLLISLRGDSALLGVLQLGYVYKFD